MQKNLKRLLRDGKEVVDIILQNILEKHILSSAKFKNALSPDDREEACLRYAQSGFFRIALVSVALTVISLTTVIRDLLVGFYNRPEEPHNIINLISAGLLLLFSLTVMTMYRYASHHTVGIGFYRTAHRLFIVVMDIALLLLLLTEFMRGQFLSFPMFYLFFYAAVPLFRFRDNLLNCILLGVAVSTEYLIIRCHFPGSDVVTDIMYFAFILAGCFIFSSYLRSFYLTTILNRYENLRLTRRLKIQSEVDPLTGCLNRYALTEAFKDYRSHGAAITVIMIDFDDFKLYNDTFSHVQGDDCLRRVSQTIANVCGGYQFHLYRYGGEEFLLVGPACDDKGVSLARDVLHAIAELKLPMPEQAARPYMSVSEGLYTMTLDCATDLNSVVAHADRQLYLAKAAGKNCAYADDARISTARSVNYA